ncbi:hypothetical protein CDD83_408 [Cordyceps sp. RAO-2017]|nr:hypothetical protein CDD83_408 [Cordyceps sp. RAO-2017]
MPSATKKPAAGLALLLAFAAASAEQGDGSRSAAQASAAGGHQTPPSESVWSGTMGSQEPCGSSAAPGARTRFPLKNGAVAVVARDDYHDSKISISYSDNPERNGDFIPLVETSGMSRPGPGQSCIPIPDAPATAPAGANATLQITYRGDGQPLYACADITYVAPDEFGERVPCLAMTRPADDGRGPARKLEAADDGSTKLGSGAIAGVTIGSLAGLTLVAAVLLFLCRRRRQKSRKPRPGRTPGNARRDRFAADNKYSPSQNSV